MTQDRFLRYLGNPDLLATISYEELKTLALAYPYAHNLRYLLVLKSGQDGKNNDFERNLVSAAAYSLDRKRLFLLLAPKTLAPKSIEQEELVLELRPIESVQRELEAKMPMAKKEEREAALKLEISERMTSPKSNGAQNPESLPKATDVRSEEAKGVDDNLQVLQVSESSKGISFGAWISQFQVPPPLEMTPKKGVLNPKNMPGIPDGDPSPREEVSQEVSLKHTEVPHSLAERSIIESKTIVSETLANLYVQQGYREKAIEMYKRLCLAFPDKSTYFAAEIEKLKK